MPHRFFFWSDSTFLFFLVVPTLGASSLARIKETEERSIRGFIKTSTALLHSPVRSTTCLPHLGWAGTSLAFVTSVSCSSQKIPVKTPILNSHLKVFCNSRMYRLQTIQKHCLSQLPKQDYDFTGCYKVPLLHNLHIKLSKCKYTILEKYCHLILQVQEKQKEEICCHTLSFEMTQYSAPLQMFSDLYRN